MNPLTLVKRIQNINSKEASLGISEDASWHAKYKDSAYVFVGGIPYDLTEGDLLTVFAQYGEIVDVNLVRDKGTGKSKGFAFLAYEDQRSTNLAVDNLNGATVAGRIIRVDHVSNYKKKEEEDEEAERKKREERGVCRAFQRGECTRGAGCKFSHDEQRAANTGWGADDQKGRWGHDKYNGPPPPRSNRNPDNRDDQCSRHVNEDLDSRDGRRHEKRPRGSFSSDCLQPSSKDYVRENQIDEHSMRKSRENERSRNSGNHDHRAREGMDRREEKRSTRNDEDLEHRAREGSDRREGKRSRGNDDDVEPIAREGADRRQLRAREGTDRREEKRSTRNDEDLEHRAREGSDRREGKRSRGNDDDVEHIAREGADRRQLRGHESEPHPLEDEDKRGDSRSARHRDTSPTRHRGRDDHRRESNR